MRRAYVVYLSCYGKIERTDGWLSYSNALAIVAYLKRHPVAKPLYMVTAFMRPK